MGEDKHPQDSGDRDLICAARSGAIALAGTAMAARCLSGGRRCARGESRVARQKDPIGEGMERTIAFGKFQRMRV
jgi:hypothetical protein